MNSTVGTRYASAMQRLIHVCIVSMLLFMSVAAKKTEIIQGKETFCNPSPNNISDPNTMSFDRNSHNNKTISNSAVKPLERKMATKGSGGGIASVTASGTGGVAFYTTARPQKGTSVSSLSLAYDKTAADGSRMQLTINGSRVYAPIPDWLLVPTALFSQSQYESCFSLFGELNDTILQNSIDKNGDRVLSYHPCFTNTLAGLRMFQMDILILNEFATDLPRVRGSYLLGQGEQAPDTVLNQRGLNSAIDTLQQLESASGKAWRSYVICDWGRDITFTTAHDTLAISQTPYYYLWRYVMDDPAFDQKKLLATYQNGVKSVLAGKTDANARQWLIDSLIVSLKRYEREFEFYKQGSSILDIVALTSEAQRRQELDLYATDALFSMLVNLVTTMQELDIEHLKAESDGFSGDTATLRSVNPAVWDATVAVMRYSAFFRYCRTSFPDVWNAFVKQLQNIATTPEVTTPVIMYSEGDTVVLNAIDEHWRRITSLVSVNRMPASAMQSGHYYLINPLGARSGRVDVMTGAVLFDLLGRRVRRAPIVMFNGQRPAGERNSVRSRQFYIVQTVKHPGRLDCRQKKAGG